MLVASHAVGRGHWARTELDAVVPQSSAFHAAILADWWPVCYHRESCAARSQRSARELVRNLEPGLAHSPGEACPAARRRSAPAAAARAGCAAEVPDAAAPAELPWTEPGGYPRLEHRPADCLAFLSLDHPRPSKALCRRKIAAWSLQPAKDRTKLFEPVRVS